MSETRNLLEQLRAGSVQRDAKEQALLALTEQVLHLATTTTDAMELYGGRAINGVLEVMTQTFPASGALTGQQGVPVGSLLVINSSADPVTVVAGLGQTGKPTTGQGVVLVPAYSFLPVAIGSNGWTAYGTSGATMSWQAFSGLQAFGIVR